MSGDRVTTVEGLGRRVRALLGSPAVASWRPPKSSAWPFERAEPFDVVIFYSACDGLTLRDGTVVLERAEIARATSWLVEERSLAWSDELFVIGERDDLVIVRDVDAGAQRAGGGVLEASTDALETFERAATGIIGYLEARVGTWDPYPAPEAAVRAALARGDADALADALELQFYPGSERVLAHAWLTLGALRARAGDAAAAMAAFERSVAARALAVRRGADATERAAAWRACAAAAAEAGAQAVAEVCAERARVP